MIEPLKTNNHTNTNTKPTTNLAYDPSMVILNAKNKLTNEEYCQLHTHISNKSIEEFCEKINKANKSDFIFGYLNHLNLYTHWGEMNKWYLTDYSLSNFSYEATIKHLESINNILNKIPVDSCFSSKYETEYNDLVCIFNLYSKIIQAKNFDLLKKYFTYINSVIMDILKKKKPKCITVKYISKLNLYLNKKINDKLKKQKLIETSTNSIEKMWYNIFG